LISGRLVPEQAGLRDRVRARDHEQHHPATARFQLLPTHLTIDGGADYDILEKNMVSTRARLRYQVQCCGFVVEMIQYDYNERQERQFRFSIDLANIGSIGSFMGGDPMNPARGGGASLFQ
jgi:hypothetical protein